MTIRTYGGYLPLTGGTLTGNLTAPNLIAQQDITLGSSRQIIWSTKSVLQSTVDGNLTLYNNANTSFGLLQFGGTTSSFPALKRSGAFLNVVLADDSAFAQMTVRTIGMALVAVSGLPSAASSTGSIAYVTDATATTRLSTVAGGGSNKVIVYSDGTNWLIL